MNKTQIQALKLRLEKPQKIAIIPHRNPDGDAIGSTLGLYHFLIQKNHQVKVIAPNAYPDFFHWMPAQEHIVNFEEQTQLATRFLQEADLVFTLDFNALHRVENMRSVLESLTADFVMIDHHQQPQDYAKYMYSDTSISSTCQMVYHFLEFLDQSQYINKQIATCLYTGIMTDTGSFRFAATTSTTHRVVADLIDKGAKNAAIHNAVYDTNSVSKLQLLGQALSNLVILEDYATAFIPLTKEEMQRFNFKKGDTEGFVNYGLSLKGIKFAVIFLEDLKEDFIKISFRSKGDFDVNTFARTHFNGGGHNNASGGKSMDTMENTTAYFQEILQQYKDQLQCE